MSKIQTFAGEFGGKPVWGWPAVSPDFAGAGERTLADLHRAVRSIGRHFKTDTVIIIGSQAILIDWPDAPVAMRTSGEIDAYPGNIREWETSHPGALASEEINAIFGWGSAFHGTHGFYIDGVDEDTAKLPPGWQERAVEITVTDEATAIRVIAPCLDDLMVSKLQRLSLKDQDFIRACHRTRPLDVALIETRLAASNPVPEIAEQARGFLETL